MSKIIYPFKDDVAMSDIVYVIECRFLEGNDTWWPEEVFINKEQAELSLEQLREWDENEVHKYRIRAFVPRKEGLDE